MIKKHFFILFFILLFPSFVFPLKTQVLTAGAVRAATSCNVVNPTYLAFGVKQISGDHTNSRPNNTDSCTDSPSSGLILPPGTLSHCSLTYVKTGASVMTLTILEDGVATSITCSSSSAAEGGCSDTTHSVTITTGKKYTSKIERDASGGAAASALVVNCLYTPTM